MSGIKWPFLALVLAIGLVAGMCGSCTPVGTSLDETVNNGVQEHRLPSGVWYSEPEPGVRCYIRYANISCLKYP